MFRISKDGVALPFVELSPNLLQQNFPTNWRAAMTLDWQKFLLSAVPSRSDPGCKKAIATLFIALATTSAALAGSVAGTGGATEATQWLNKIQLGLAYEKQIQQYLMQGLQYKTQLQNLILAESPGITDVIGIVNGISQMMTVGKSIGGSLAEIDRNFANTFKNPIANELANNFVRWNQTSSDTLQGALKAAGKHRDQFASDAAMLQDLYAASQATMGTRDSIQMVAAINSEQVNQLHKLSDLISTQNIAAATYMATITAKSQGKEDLNKSIMKITPTAKPNPADFVGKP